MLDEKVAKLHLPALSAELAVPTQGQGGCTRVKVEGPFKGGHHRYCMSSPHFVQSSPSLDHVKMDIAFVGNTGQLTTRWT